MFAGGNDSSPSNDYPVAAVMARGDGVSSYVGGELSFQTKTASESALSQKMVIDKDGKVGINTTDPAELLHVEGIARVDTGINHNGTTILNSSRELINIAELAINAAAAGSYKLYVNGTTYFSTASTSTRLLLKGSGSGGASDIDIDVSGGSYGYPLRVFSGSTNKCRITHTGDFIADAGAFVQVSQEDNSFLGKVGVGTNSPDRLLHLYGGASGQATPVASAQLVLEDDGSNNYITFLNPNTGNAGIMWGDPQDSARAQLI